MEKQALAGHGHTGARAAGAAAHRGGRGRVGELERMRLMRAANRRGLEGAVSLLPDLAAAPRIGL